MIFSELLSNTLYQGNTATLDIQQDWLQGRTVYGGLQGALAMLAMRLLVPHSIQLRSFQATFVAPIPAGRVCAEARILRQGKSATQVQADIVVAQQVCFSCIAIFAAKRNSQVAREPAVPDCGVSISDAKRFPYIDSVTPQFTQHFDMRWAAGQLPFTAARDPHCKIYVRHRDDDAVSDAHLIGLADAIPPTVIATLSDPAMVSSMNWQLELLRSPEELQGNTWYRFDADLTACRDGYGWQTAHIWSQQGELVALSRQCVAVFA